MELLAEGAIKLNVVIEEAPAIISIAAGVALVLLLPLYFSQRRDLRRLRHWMEDAPGHPAEDVAASEAILDRAELELEELVGAPAAAAPPSAPAPDTSPGLVTAHQRVTSERPALERITMERAALIPHPRWQRFKAWITQPRWLVAIAVGAVLVGVAAIFGSGLILETQDPDRTTRAGAVDPSQVSVAVLNGTVVEGLGGKVGDDVEANGYDLGVVSTFPDPTEQTLIMFESRQERAARRIARDLGVAPVQPIDRRVQRLAEGADVVVIAGQDRASD